jgi:protein O-GlcNAc transferase
LRAIEDFFGENILSKLYITIVKLFAVALCFGGIASWVSGCEDPQEELPERQITRFEDLGERYFQQGLALAEQRQTVQAVAAFKRALSYAADDPRIYFHLANAYFRYDAYPQGIAAYQKATALDSSFAAAYFNLGSLYAVMERFPEAMKEMQQAVAIDSQYALAYNGLGKLYYRQGDHEHAVDAYTQAVRWDSGFVEAWSNLGEVQFKQGEMEAAGFAFARALAVDSTAAPAHAGLGGVKFKQQLYAEAIEHLENAVHFDRLLTKAFYKLGQAYLRFGEQEKGHRVLEVAARLEKQDVRVDELLYALTSYPDRAELYFDLGVVYGQREEYEKAKLKYERAIALDSTFASAYNNLGNIYLRARKPDRAFPLYRRAAAMDSTYAPAYSGLGNVHMIRGNYRAAIEAFRRALRLNPDDEKTRRSIQIAVGMAKKEVSK